MHGGTVWQNAKESQRFLFALLSRAAMSQNLPHICRIFALITATRDWLELQVERYGSPRPIHMDFGPISYCGLHFQLWPRRQRHGKHTLQIQVEFTRDEAGSCSLPHEMSQIASSIDMSLCLYHATGDMWWFVQANSFATSVGSKAITIFQAVIIAGIFEFLGAVLLGSSVTSTIKSGIAKSAAFSGAPGCFTCSFSLHSRARLETEPRQKALESLSLYDT